jgi:16S rRNA (guanine966-N2)-methyltransferase
MPGLARIAQVLLAEREARLTRLDSRVDAGPDCGLLVRVIAGEFGGRRLQAPRGLKTRPTSDRVREALFMALEPLAGLQVVDLYAGSGALGIEALSRGARFVDFVESDRSARAALGDNLATLALSGRARVWPLTLPGGLARLGEALAAADLVLADPPYGGGPAREVLHSLGEPGRLKAGARLVLEHHAKDELPEASGALARARVRRYGETTVSTYDVKAEAGS